MIKMYTVNICSLKFTKKINKLPNEKSGKTPKKIGGERKKKKNRRL
jgi:hypothetical protein